MTDTLITMIGHSLLIWIEKYYLGMIYIISSFSNHWTFQLLLDFIQNFHFKKFELWNKLLHVVSTFSDCIGRICYVAVPTPH